jgi:hypothetical protein
MGVRTRRKHKRFASALVNSSAYPASRNQAWRILEALWKQEGANGRDPASNTAKVERGENRRKRRKCRANSKMRESNRGQLPLTIGLKSFKKSARGVLDFRLSSKVVYYRKMLAGGFRAVRDGSRTDGLT